MKDSIIGVIGCGNMGGAIVRGMVDNAVVNKDNIFLYDKDVHKAQNLADEKGVHLKDLKTAVSDAGTVILAVKPQDSAELLKEISDDIGEKTIISIMAGVKIDTITSTLGKQLPVVRAMPNLAALVSESMTCIACNELVKEREDVKDIFSGIGQVLEVAEEEMDAVTAVSGSGPAYLFYLAEAMIKAGVSAGLDEETAKELTEQTLVGAALFMAGASEEPGELVEKVASKGGTTEAALRVFEKEGFGDIVKKAIEAAKKRSEELSKG